MIRWNDFVTDSSAAAVHGCYVIHAAARSGLFRLSRMDVVTGQFTVLMRAMSSGVHMCVIFAFCSGSGHAEDILVCR